jgi:Phage integrase family
MGIARKIEHAGEAAGLPFPIHVHMLRHSAGYALAAKGMDTRRLQHFLGHASITNTVRYTAMSAGAPLMRRNSGAHRNPPVACGRADPRLLRFIPGGREATAGRLSPVGCRPGPATALFRDDHGSFCHSRTFSRN